MNSSTETHNYNEKDTVLAIPLPLNRRDIHLIALIITPPEKCATSIVPELPLVNDVNAPPCCTLNG